MQTQTTKQRLDALEKRVRVLEVETAWLKKDALLAFVHEALKKANL